jgi:integrase
MILRHLEQTGSQPRKATAVFPTLEQCWQQFLADITARNLHSSTIRKYRLLGREMQVFAEQQGLKLLKDFSVSILSQFRSGWTMSPLSSLKKLERLKAFFAFGAENKWIDENPARKLKRPRVSDKPTLPYTPDEMFRILTATGPYVEQTAARGRDNALRLKVLILVLRYTGMRIGDAVKLSNDRIDGNRLRLYTQKTGVPVCCVIPDFVKNALESIPRVRDEHFFWAGVGKLEVIVGSWQKRLRKLFRLAKVSSGHAHRFRDTFATELLLAGVPIERVSILLGHQSIKVTEKHYAAWTDARQRQTEEDLQRAWARDPIVLYESAATRQLREETEPVN